MDQVPDPVIIHHDFRELRQKASNAAKHILMCNNLGCTNNYNIPTTTWSINEENKWLLNLKCSVCHFSWCVCYKCNNVKVRLVTSRQILNHNNSSHIETGIARKNKRRLVRYNDSMKKKEQKHNEVTDETTIVAKNNSCTMIENTTTTTVLTQTDNEIK
jgi:hypothetical protein